MTLKASVFLELNDDNQISIFYVSVRDLMTMSVQSDFVSVRCALIQLDFVLFLLAFHLLTLTLFAHLLLVHQLAFAAAV